MYTLYIFGRDLGDRHICFELYQDDELVIALGSKVGEPAAKIEHLLKEDVVGILNKCFENFVYEDTHDKLTILDELLETI